MTGREPSPVSRSGASIEQARRRANVAAASKARKRLTLVVAGPRQGEFLDGVLAAGQFRSGSILTVETLSGDLFGLVDARVAVYCPHFGAANGALSAVSDLPFPVFVARSGEASTLAESRLRTSPASSRPVSGSASVYYLSSLALVELRKYLLPDIARAYHPNETELAAAIPAFRSIVAAKLTMDCAMNSLKIAAVSALADHVPVLGLVTGGIASAGDTIAITALQMNMLLRIAAAYGKKPELARLLELIPVVGGGYGWRALAREASGFIPVAGIPIKAAIAYAGTLVVGQAASYYYETGLQMSPNAIAALYREASDRAKEFARYVVARVHSRQGRT